MGKKQQKRVTAFAVVRLNTRAMHTVQGVRIPLSARVVSPLRIYIYVLRITNKLV